MELKDELWMLHVGLKSPLKEMVKAEAKDSGMTYAAIVRNRLWHSYQMDAQTAGVDYETTDNKH